MSSLTKPVDVFIKLEENGYIKEDNLDLLKALLEAIRRPPLVQKVEDFEKERGNRPDDLCHKLSETSISTIVHDKHVSPVKQHEASMVEPRMQDPDVMGAADICEKVLRHYYENHYAEIYPMPYRDDTLKLDDIYTSLTLEMKSGNKHFEREGLFAQNDDSRNPTRILIEGDPGYGKSTFSKKLAYDWSREKCDFLKQFKLLFCLEMKEIKPCIRESIVDTLLPDDSTLIDNWDHLFKYIKCNQEKVCFVLDGWDEKSESLQSEVDKIIQDKMLCHCKVVVTSRKIRGDMSDMRSHGSKLRRNVTFNRKLTLNGFTVSALKQYVTKHFENVARPDASRALFGQIEMSSKKDEIMSLLKCPLNVCFFCIAFMSPESDIISKITSLYDKIIELIIEGYCEKYDKNDPSTKDDINRQLLFLGELSTRALIEDVIKFDHKELKLQENADVARMGFLSTYDNNTKFSTEPPGYIIHHKSFKEFLAAKYIAYLCHTNRGEFASLVRKLYEKDCWKSEPVFRFISGLLDEDTKIMFECLEDAKFPVLLQCLLETGCTAILVTSCITALSKDNVLIFLRAHSSQEIRVCQQIVTHPEFMPKETDLFMVDLLSLCKLDTFMPLLYALALKASKLNVWVSFITSNCEDSPIMEKTEAPSLKSAHYCKGCDAKAMKSFTSEDFKSILSRFKQTGMENVVQEINIRCASVPYDEFPRILDCLDSNDWLEFMALDLELPNQSTEDAVSSGMPMNYTLKSCLELNRRRAKDQWQFTRLTYTSDRIQFKSYSPRHYSSIANFYDISVKDYNRPNLFDDISEFLESDCEKAFEISLSNCQLTQNDYVKLCTKMSNCSKLSTLRLICNKSTGDKPLNVDDFVTFAESVTKLPRLKILSIGDWRFPEYSDPSGRWKDAWVKFFGELRVHKVDLNNCLPSNRPTSSRQTYPPIDGLCKAISMSGSNPSHSDTDSLNAADTGGSDKYDLTYIDLSRNKLTVGDVLQLQKAGLLDDDSKPTIFLYYCTVNKESADILKHYHWHSNLEIEN
ncbi:uncharacterized protein LOC144447162 [Glandiceps talaboti]